ncbi:MAG: phosphotransferase [Polyangiaceae bacterium]
MAGSLPNVEGIDLSVLQDLVTKVVGYVGPSSVSPMPGGASTRKFFRVEMKGNGPCAAVAFFVPDATRSDEIDKTDGRRHVWPFIEVHGLLRERNVAVPDILVDGSDRGWLIVEDLGDDTLAAYLARKPETKEICYRVAVTDLAKAQRSLASLPEASVIGRRAFDEDLLAWEIHHFREWALEARDIHLSAADREIFDGVATRLARRIASWSRGFVHRDYQSRNLMVREVNGAPQLVWIDFQDALLGPRVYDLVALLNDSYQTFDRAFVEARLDDFANEAGMSASDRELLGREFDLVTVQRKLKDAGRFIFIDRQKGNPGFLPFVEPTIAKARASLDRLQDDEDMRALAAVLQRALGG